ncbi:hypothetical protein SS50377_21226 [Spironucleus salmonicida]|uniref:Uncharacterized protein n=1 Tax=Spironucleus salmonicida TaxID=348837 RepID=V6LT82_9EUKA|nr:hypothetical protein SS50377_21226 [Spironucleus salmonicida]|eukprot:EST43999.1 Hypothetical protein SS50377_16308 [Spironucleus salmonicida]
MQDAYYVKQLCTLDTQYTYKKYQLLFKETIDEVSPGQIVIFNKDFENIIQLVKPALHIYIFEEYLKYSDQNQVPQFHIGLNYFPCLSEVKVLLTGFKSQVKKKKQYMSLSLGLNSQMMNIQTIEQLKELIYQADQSTSILFIIYQPFLLIKLLTNFTKDQQDLIIRKSRSTAILTKLSTLTSLNKQLIQNTIEDPQYYLNGLDNLNISTFKQPASETKCKFHKVNVIKDQLDQSFINLMQKRSFMLLVDPSYKKYYDISQKFMQMTNNLSISKIYGFHNLSNDLCQQQFSFTNLQLVESEISLVSLQLIYSKPIIIVQLFEDEDIKLYQDAQYSEFRNGGPNSFIDFCTILPKSVVDENLEILRIYSEKIFVVGTKEQLSVYQSRIQNFLNIRSILWLQTAIIVYKGATIKNSFQSQTVQYQLPKLVDNNLTILTPNVLFDLQNTSLSQLSQGNFVSIKNSIKGLSAQTIINSIFDQITEDQSVLFAKVLSQQIPYTSGTSINPQILIDLLHQNIPFQHAMSRSTKFEEQFDDIILNQQSPHQQHSKMSDASVIAEELQLDLDDPIFVME